MNIILNNYKMYYMLDICYIIGRRNDGITSQQSTLRMDRDITNLCLSYDVCIVNSSFGPIPSKKNRVIYRIHSCCVSETDDLIELVIEIKKSKDLFIRNLIQISESDKIDDELIYCTHEFYKQLDSHFKKKYKKKHLNSVNDKINKIVSRNIIDYLTV